MTNVNLSKREAIIYEAFLNTPEISLDDLYDIVIKEEGPNVTKPARTSINQAIQRTAYKLASLENKTIIRTTTLGAGSKAVYKLATLPLEENIDA